MPKKPKIYTCSVKGCGRRYTTADGGTSKDCPAHYQRKRRSENGETSIDLRSPIRGVGDAPQVPVKFFISKAGRELLASSAAKAGLSLSAYCARLVLVPRR